MRGWTAQLRTGVGDAIVFALCYLVLCACGWALDHLLLGAEAEPAP